MRLIDADALKLFMQTYCDKNKTIALHIDEILDLITNAPTVQRGGWVSVPIEPTETMLRALLNQFVSTGSKTIEQNYKAMLQAAPKG